MHLRWGWSLLEKLHSYSNLRVTAYLKTYSFHIQQGCWYTKYQAARQLMHFSELSLTCHLCFCWYFCLEHKKLILCYCTLYTYFKMVKLVFAWETAQLIFVSGLNDQHIHYILSHSHKTKVASQIIMLQSHTFLPAEPTQKLTTLEDWGKQIEENKPQGWWES